ncbi:hypothetical protein [Paraburkholderia caballeronis]|uniref:hypothetical protein n=1 Tax=Paraburkholderia caballeronis TaxID=416943 RepID=UPI00106554BA|nr:hypothetical protein [Paraburkholderia caballeronis]
MAATNRWLTATDTCHRCYFSVARPNLPSAVASEDKENRHSIVAKDGFLWLLGPAFARPILKIGRKNTVPTKHKKAGGVKTASLRAAR